MTRIDRSRLDERAYGEIARVLEDGGVVCMPTDTVYGLAVDTSNETAIESLFRLKGRPPSRPLILLIDSVAMAKTLTFWRTEFDAVAERFWPGPISLVLPARPEVSRLLTSGTGTLALRWPDSEVAVRIVRTLGRPITSTSANPSGEPVAPSAEAVAAVLPDVDLIIDAGTLAAQAPSTLLDLSRNPPALLREGPVRFEDIRRLLAVGTPGRTA